LYSSVYEATEPKADGGVGVDVVRRLIYYGSSTALKPPQVRLEHIIDSESEACMAWDYCLGNARLLGLHSPQHYPNPLSLAVGIDRGWLGPVRLRRRAGGLGL
jgi:hypothetical protein